MKFDQTESEEKLLQDADRYVEILIRSGKVKLEEMDPTSKKFESIVQSNVGHLRKLRNAVIDLLRHERQA